MGLEDECRGVEILKAMKSFLMAARAVSGRKLSNRKVRLQVRQFVDEAKGNREVFGDREMAMAMLKCAQTVEDMLMHPAIPYPRGEDRMNPFQGRA